MQAIPKLTTQRLAELPAGTPIRIGALQVIFDHCSIDKDYKSRDAVFVHYIEQDGTPRRQLEYAVLAAGTEFTDSVMCANCGKFRHPSDIVRRSIQKYRGSEMLDFCKDTDCAARCQALTFQPRQRPVTSQRTARRHSI